MNRTHSNGQLRLSNVSENVNLKGWVAKKRDLGGLIFIDLRDRYGITQIVVNPSNKHYELASKVRNEFVLEVSGKVIERTSKNPNLPTGDIEVSLEELIILNEALTTPLIIADETDALEETRLKYRYLDLRRPIMQKNFILRHKVSKAVREFLDNNGFIDFETPILTKSTPEGARDYLVPSRVNRGEFYALPQSPQIFKQLLMVSGFERYYQIAKCFRDEDLRSDRQPEFTQIDIETSFLSQDEILSINEEMMKHIMKTVMNIDIKIPFERITYDESMRRFGVDKPDTRFGMELIDMSEVFKDSSFSVFKNTLDNNGEVKCIKVSGASDKYSRKNIDKLTDFVKRYKAKGLAWLKYTSDGLNGPIAKFFTDTEKDSIIKQTGANVKDLLLFVADSKKVVAASLGNLRNKLAKDLDLIDNNVYDFKWVVDWPLFEYDEEDKRYYSLHHPFTAPKQEDIKYLETDPSKCYSDSYDLVLHGYEIGGGSLRIHQNDVQEKVFKALGIEKEEQELKFGFLLEALKYGTPPHGGIAFGLDRIVMILLNTKNIKDVVAFPKTTSAQCLMTNAPSDISNEQLDELNIKKTNQ